MLKYQTIINSSFIILYYFITCYFFVKFAIGEIKITVKIPIIIPININSGFNLILSNLIFEVRILV